MQHSKPLAFATHGRTMPDMTPSPLFSTHSLQEEIITQSNKALRMAEAVPAAKLLASTPEALADRIMERVGFDPVSLDDDNKTVLPPTQAGHGVNITIDIPFFGDARMLRKTSSHGQTNKIRGEVTGTTLKLNVTVSSRLSTAEQLEVAEEEIAALEAHLASQRSMVDVFRESARVEVLEVIACRRDQAETAMQLAAALREGLTEGRD